MKEWPLKVLVREDGTFDLRMDQFPTKQLPLLETVMPAVAEHAVKLARKERKSQENKAFLQKRWAERRRAEREAQAGSEGGGA